MKVIQRMLLLSICLFLASCRLFDIYKFAQDEKYLWVINSDGSDLHKLISMSHAPFKESSIWDIYVTMDGRPIIGADKFYLNVSDNLHWISFGEGISKDFLKRLSLSKDNKAYYCCNGDLIQFDLATHTQMNLTASIDGYYVDPMISSDNSIVTLIYKPSYESHEQILCYYKVADGSMTLVPQGGSTVFNGVYSPFDNRLYYEKSAVGWDGPYGGLYKIDLDGANDTSIVMNFTNIDLSFGFTSIAQNIAMVHRIDGYHSLYDYSLYVINVTDNSSVLYTELRSSLPVKFPQDSPEIFFAVYGDIYGVNMNTHQWSSIPNTPYVKSYICPTWDGKKMFFITREEE